MSCTPEQASELLDSHALFWAFIAALFVWALLQWVWDEVRSWFK